MYPRPNFHREAVIANIQPIRVASEIGFRSVWSNPPTPPTVVRSRFGGRANSLGGLYGCLPKGHFAKEWSVAHPHRKLTAQAAIEELTAYVEQ